MPLILVVDDEETILELIRFNLEKEGFRVETAVDGPQALDKIAKVQPDLVVLDWMLPGLPGLEICRRLRGDAKTAQLPIIMLTARGEEVDKILGLEMGGNDYMTKPFSPRELAARIRAHLRATAARPPVQESYRSVQHGDIYLDADCYVAKKGNKLIELAPKEFDLLFLLLSNPGRVFRREDILSQIWGYDYLGDTRTVDVHIRHLRQKIEDDPNLPALILTVRGIGYKFKEQG